MIPDKAAQPQGFSMTRNKPPKSDSLNQAFNDQVNAIHFFHRERKYKEAW